MSVLGTPVQPWGRDVTHIHHHRLKHSQTSRKKTRERAGIWPHLSVLGLLGLDLSQSCQLLVPLPQLWRTRGLSNCARVWDGQSQTHPIADAFDVGITHYCAIC